MSNAFKKIATVALLALVLVTGVVVDAPKASAATAAELQAQLAALQAQLAALQGSSQTCTFTRSLTVGSRGADVTCLQDYLRAGGHLSVASTGYFGPLTRAAVARWQAANGVSPAAGYFGPLSRAKYVSLTAVVVVPPVTPTPTPTPVPPVVTGLTVALAPANPSAATVVADTTSADGAQALANFTALRFTGTGKVTTLKLKRTGISADADLSNVYLFDGETRLADSPIVSNTFFTFSNSAGLFSVNGTRDIWVKADIANGTSSGKTIALGVASVSDVTADVAVSGTFPLTGNNMTTATVSDLGKLTLAHVSDPGTSVDPGLINQKLWEFSLTAADQKISISSITLTAVGTADASVFSNLKLHDGTAFIGPTVAGLASNKTVTFSFSPAYEIPSGVVRNIQLRGDIVGGSARNFYFQVAKSSDIPAMDTNYGVMLKLNKTDTYSIIKATNTTSINSGTLSITRRTDSPSANVAKDSLAVSLARFDVKATGEALKVTELVVGTVLTGAGDNANLDNGKILLDGVQIGTTKDLDSDNTADADATDDDVAGTDDDTTFTFGNSFVVNAGQTRVLEIVADIKTGAGAALTANDTIAVELETGASNVTRMATGDTTNSPAATGNTLTVSAASLTAAKNPSVGPITVVQGATSQRIGSWLLTAGAAEGVNVTSITLKDDSTSTDTWGDAFQNLTLWHGNTQLGTTIAAPTATGDEVTQTFNLATALNIPAGQSRQIDLKADVLSSATWGSNDELEWDSVTGTGTTTSQAITSATDVLGQAVTVSTGGALNVIVDSTTPIAGQQHVMGQTERTLATWEFSASNVEDIRVTQINVKNASNDGIGGFVKNLKLFVDGVQVGPTVAALDAADNTGNAVFSVSSGQLFTIPRGGSKDVTLRADITAYSDLDTTLVDKDNDLIFRVNLPADITGAASDDIIAIGTSGNYTDPAAANAGNKDANKQYVFRNTMTAAIAATASSARQANDVVATLTLTGVSGASANAQFRAALQANDEADGGAAGNDWQALTAGAADNTAGTSTTKLDGSNSILWDVAADGTGTELDANDRIFFDFGTSADVDNTLYTKASFWIRSDVTASAGALKFFTNDAADLTTLINDIAFPTTGFTNGLPSAANAWRYVEISLTGATGTSRYAGIYVSTGVETGAATNVLIEDFRFWNDSMVVDIAGDLNATAATSAGAKVRLEQAGSVKAIGYVNNNSASTSSVSVTLTAGDDIGNQAATTGTTLEVGGSAQAYSMIADTTSIVKADTAQVESVTFSMDLGTDTSAGDFRWWDQAVPATDPITWLNGATPISTTRSY